MTSLYQALMSQHSRSLKPMRFAEQMTIQLQSFVEEVILENDLSCLVIESLSLREERSLREVERIRALTQAAEKFFLLINTKDGLRARITEHIELHPKVWEKKPILLEKPEMAAEAETFLLISSHHFSVLLVALEDKNAVEDAYLGKAQQVIWSFEPNTVFTAMEYIEARFAVEYPPNSPELRKIISHTTPKTISLPMTLTVTTKIAGLWQEQAGREVAINRIANAIRGSLALNDILQTTIKEVGTALGADLCALQIQAEPGSDLPVMTFTQPQLQEDDERELHGDLAAYSRRMSNNPQLYVRNGAAKYEKSIAIDSPVIVTPIYLPEKFFGVLLVQSKNPARSWQESEILLLRTVADQVAVAINHAGLLVDSEKAALTDSLTGLYNRRFLEQQLEREYKTAMRKEHPLSLLLVDIDHFKLVNDNFGHLVGDAVLREVGQILSSSLRSDDTAARYGGEEFVILMPETDTEGAKLVAERLRSAIADEVFPEINHLTASFGIASCPAHAETWQELFKLADNALYSAKQAGRNLVCVAEATEAISAETEEQPEVPETSEIAENVLVKTEIETAELPIAESLLLPVNENNTAALTEELTAVENLETSVPETLPAEQSALPETMTALLPDETNAPEIPEWLKMAEDAAPESAFFLNQENETGIEEPGLNDPTETIAGESAATVNQLTEISKESAFTNDTVALPKTTAEISVADFLPETESEIPQPSFLQNLELDEIEETMPLPEIIGKHTRHSAHGKI